MLLIDTSAVVPVSVTRSFCPMNCKHCGGVYLKHMIGVDEMEDYARKGYRTFLISGGMLRDGSIPFEPFRDDLSRLKKKYDLVYNFHIGFPKDFPEIVEEMADVISADFFANEEVMKEVYGISRRSDEILEILLMFSKPVVPHVTIGILCGKITHEFDSLEILSKHFDSIVLNVFVPTPGTLYSECDPPKVEEVVEVFKKARRMFKKVFLGCMQPRGVYRVKLQNAIFNLVDGITKPVISKPNVKNCCALEIISQDPSTS